MILLSCKPYLLEASGRRGDPQDDLTPAQIRERIARNNRQINEIRRDIQKIGDLAEKTFRSPKAVYTDGIGE